MRGDDDGAGALLLALDHATASWDVAHDEARVLLRGLDLDGHDRLEDDRVGLAQSVLDGHGTGNLEGGLGGVDVVVGTVDELDA